MILAWIPGERGMVRQECQIDCIPDQAVWIDLVDPTRDEELYTEKKLGLELPTRAEMQEIEASSRLYRENGAAYMTATLLSKTETMAPETTQVVFILGHERMVTIRYAEPWSFRTFANRAPKSGITTAQEAFAVLLDTTVERLADLLEIVQVEVETITQRVFRRLGKTSERDLRKSLTSIAAVGNILSKVRESLIDKNRIITFVKQSPVELLGSDSRARLTATEHDITVLSDHANFNSTKIGFLLDATLGMINIGVNDNMRLLSWVMVAVMWPTLVSGFFSMNVELPVPQHGSMVPFYICVSLAFAPLLLGLGWYLRKQRRGG